MSFDPLHDIPLLRGPVPLAHMVLRFFVRSGDSAVDATCGNGNDTLLLAELVGPAGRVWAFDIQQEAMESTARKLAANGLSERVTLVAQGHETLAGQVNIALNTSKYVHNTHRRRCFPAPRPGISLWQCRR